MTRRIAVTLSLIAFALCVSLGIAADNTFSTVVSKALFAMVMTLFIGLIVGAMAQKMLDENLAVEAKKLQALEVASPEPVTTNSAAPAGKQTPAAK